MVGLELDDLPTPTLAPGRRDALTRFLDVVETWEERPEVGSPAVVRHAWIWAGGTFACALAMRILGSAAADWNLERFFWIDGIARWVRELCVDFATLGSPLLLLLAVVGFAAAALLTAKPSGPATRYVVIGEIAGGTVSAASVLFVTAIFLLQVVLWIVLIAIITALVVGFVVAMIGAAAS